MPSLTETIAVELGAQEPWPNDVKLFQPYAMEQILLPDNANCLAVQAYLHMCGLPFQIEHRANAEFMSPSGKVPFIKCGAFVVSELEPIVQFIGNKGISLSKDLTSEEKSDMRAYMSLIHTVLMNAELYICWCDPKTYNQVTKIRNGSVYPWPLNHYQNWIKKYNVTQKLKLISWHKKSMQEIYKEVENCCSALSERLDGKEYFFNSGPCELDAFVYGHICSILYSPGLCYELSQKIMNYPNLVNHCLRIHKKFIKNMNDLLNTLYVNMQKEIANPKYNSYLSMEQIETIDDVFLSTHIIESLNNTNANSETSDTGNENSLDENLNENDNNNSLSPCASMMNAVNLGYTDTIHCDEPISVWNTAVDYYYHPLQESNENYGIGSQNSLGSGKNSDKNSINLHNSLSISNILNISTVYMDDDGVSNDRFSIPTHDVIKSKSKIPVAQNDLINKENYLDLDTSVESESNLKCAKVLSDDETEDYPKLEIKRSITNIPKLQLRRT